MKTNYLQQDASSAGGMNVFSLFRAGRMARALVGFALLGVVATGCESNDEDVPEPPAPTLTVESLPAEITFGALAEESYTYKVTTNQSSWEVKSDQPWCVVTKNTTESSFTVTALESTSETAVTPATITVSAGSAPSLTFIARQSAAQYDVYLSGAHIEEETMGACYWKNGQRVDLDVPAGSAWSHAVPIVVTDGGVYVGGAYSGANGEVACYWANNERTDLPLPDGADNPSVISLFVSEGRIYAAGGYDIDGNQIDVACIWVDGQRIDLTGSGEEGQCASIVVDNGTIYAAGYFDANNSKSACYWKIPEGGRPERVDLDMPEWSEDPLALSATISDGKLYLAGFYSDADYKSYPYYWTDGVRTDLPASENATAYSIAVDGSDVYVAGDYGENHTPCYWKNGALTLLPLYGEPYYNLITAKVCDGSLYITGAYADEMGNSTPGYWKNGTYVRIPNESGYCDGIAVVKR